MYKIKITDYRGRGNRGYRGSHLGFWGPDHTAHGLHCFCLCLYGVLLLPGDISWKHQCLPACEGSLVQPSRCWCSERSALLVWHGKYHCRDARLQHGPWSNCVPQCKVHGLAWYKCLGKEWYQKRGHTSALLRTQLEPSLIVHFNCIFHSAYALWFLIRKTPQENIKLSPSRRSLSHCHIS